MEFFSNFQCVSMTDQIGSSVFDAVSIILVYKFNDV